jgi:Zn-dependent protease
MSIVIHEYAHGYVAYLYGDDTARLQGRLTLNPLKHLELFGSIILPLVLLFSKAGFILGWAKPVPYNPDNLKGGRKANVMVALAGILSNLGIAIIFGLIMRFAPVLGIESLSDVAINSFLQDNDFYCFIKYCFGVF